MASSDGVQTGSSRREAPEEQVAQQLLALRERLDAPFRLMGVMSLGLLLVVLLPFRMHWVLAAILVGSSLIPFVWIYRVWRCPRCGSSLGPNMRRPACRRCGASAR